jgi:hypothetical protein
MRLRLVSRGEDQNEDLGAIYYSERSEDAEMGSHPAHIAAEVRVPRDKFDELLSLARIGRYPSEIDLQVSGMEYGPGLAGESKEWDTSSTSKRKGIVTYVGFALPLGGAAIQEAAEESGAPLDQPVTAQVLQAFAAQLQAIKNSLWWILFFLIALLVVLLWRTH